MKPKPAPAPKVDVDLSLMGEFVGPVRVGDENEYETIGVQIRHIGDGGFEAMQYVGGLPGQKSYAGESIP